MTVAQADIADKISGFYEGHRNFLCFYAMGYVGSYQDSEDIVHSVFEKMLSRGEKLGAVSDLNSYFMAAVRNSCLNYLSNKEVRGRYVSSYFSENKDSDDRDFLNSRIEAEILWEIFSKVEQLPKGCRQVFKMSYLDKYTNQEIADKLGISVNTVKSQKARSKELLRESLKNLFSVAAIIFGF